MSEKIQKLLAGRGDNYLLPFFWQHGEDEETLRNYMQVIQDSNIQEVCVESRPHPDFAGPKWWEDMDVILDEAKKRGMRVWILDDSHFPTGFANGAMEKEPDELCRQSILSVVHPLKAGETLELSEEELKKAPEWEQTEIEKFAGEKDPRVFEDDRLFSIYAVNPDGSTEELAVTEGKLSYTADRDVKVYALYLSRNYGYHTKYINMCLYPSVRVLIDAVYEPHWEHYKDEFGKTIAGFFSDEPELGNGHLYEQSGYLGNPDMDYPWSQEIEEALKERLGKDFAGKLYLLWEQEGDADETAKIQFIYMDVLTKLVKKDFSFQLGNWCREHGVKYIGYLIEDNDMHCKTGSSLGHYFRGLAGEDWAGIDDIGGQVYPQGEDDSFNEGVFRRRDGSFYHYMLGKLGSSAAAVEPLKQGNSMCEIFGAYGWKEGVKLEKYLVDHFMVRGINHFVPHAFSPKAFPDPDCPPHFYAHGHNPQYRHFGALMAYTNRVLELINGGRHIAPAAVLYHGDASWSGYAMTSHEVARKLADSQSEFDYIPQDVFAEPEEYSMEITEGALRVNTQNYQVLFVPECDYIRTGLAKAVPVLAEKGIGVYFVNRFPKGIADAEGEEAEQLLDGVKGAAALVSLSEIVDQLREKDACEIEISPQNDRIRFYHYEETDGSGVFLFVNEGTEIYTGEIALRDIRNAYLYDAWNNRVTKADYDGKRLMVSIEPLKSCILVLDADGETPELSESFAEKKKGTTEITFTAGWKRSLSAAVTYPAFGEEKEVSLPDALEKEEPVWSGIARYTNRFTAESGKKYLLEITDASEGVEVFVNGKSLGIQVVPVYEYDLTEAVKVGENEVIIEVATTLEREMSTVPDPMAEVIGGGKEPESASGLNGKVVLYKG